MAIAQSVDSGTEQAERKEEEKAHSILPWCNSTSMTIAAVCSSGVIDKDHVLQRGGWVYVSVADELRVNFGLHLTRFQLLTELTICRRSLL